MKMKNMQTYCPKIIEISIESVVEHKDLYTAGSTSHSPSSAQLTLLQQWQNNVLILINNILIN